MTKIILKISLFIFLVALTQKSYSMQKVEKSIIENKDDFKNPQKALLYAFLPGAGQIYNEKWWKVPIVWGGFYGLWLVFDFNQNFVNDFNLEVKTRQQTGKGHFDQYSFLSDESTFEVLRFYKRNRDYSIVLLLALFGIQMVDAYVDARLSKFDISDKLTYGVRPNFVPSQYHTSQLGLELYINMKL